VVNNQPPSPRHCRTAGSVRWRRVHGGNVARGGATRRGRAWLPRQVTSRLGVWLIFRPIDADCWQKPKSEQCA